MFYFMLISAKATKMPTKTRPRALTLGNLHFLCAYTCTNGEIHIIPITATAESNEYSRVTALSCTHEIISHIEEKVGAFTKLYIWRDECASQFRSRFVFSFLSHLHLEKETEWHFNEAHHGKGPIDGVVVQSKIKSFEK